MMLSNTVRNKAATHIGEIDLKSVHDTADRCLIMSLAMLPNDRLVAVDNDNSTVKLIYTYSGKYLSELTLDDPRDVAATTKDEVAVASFLFKKIIILKVTDILAKVREISVNGPCSGIAYVNNTLLVTVARKCGIGRLDIFDLNGNMIRQIKRTASNNGIPLFAHPTRVCISTGGETIIVVSLTCEKHQVYAKSRHTLKSPKQMCTNNSGNVFVCGGVDRLSRLSIDGQFEEFLTEADGLEHYSYSVAHCQALNRLFMGNCADSLVQIYELS